MSALAHYDAATVDSSGCRQDEPGQAATGSTLFAGGRRGAARWTLLAAVLAIAAAAFLGWRLLQTVPETGHETKAEPRDVTPAGKMAAFERTTIDVFEKASPSVVHITTTRVQRDPFRFNLFELPQGTGSGFVWNDEGHVVTNAHVLRNAQSAKVRLSNGSTWDAQLVGTDPANEVAVLQIGAGPDELTPIQIGKSSNLRVGQQVFAIGNPFGLDQTLTTGVVSGLGREIVSASKQSIEGVIQTDAAINPGNSGGPLLDSSSRLVGVNTAIYSPSGAFAGVGFAVPVDTINRVVPRIISEGGVERPGLGVYVFPESVDRKLDVEGVLVRDVVEGSPAAKAGIRGTKVDERGEVVLGDRIVSIDGTTIDTPDALYDALEEQDVGDEVTVTVRRADGKRELNVTLQPLPTLRD